MMGGVARGGREVFTLLRYAVLILEKKMRKDGRKSVSLEAVLRKFLPGL